MPIFRVEQKNAIASFLALSCLATSIALPTYTETPNSVENTSIEQTEKNEQLPMNLQDKYVKEAQKYFEEQQEKDNQEETAFDKNVEKKYSYTFEDGSSITLTTNTIITGEANAKYITQNENGQFELSNNVTKSTVAPAAYKKGDPMVVAQGGQYDYTGPLTPFTVATHGEFKFKYDTPDSFTSVRHDAPSTFNGTGWKLNKPLSDYTGKLRESAYVGTTFSATLKSTTVSRNVEVHCDTLGKTKTWSGI
ncbi:hypothetical protein [Aneurinibacillus aneurinilyticus]|uniref:hypothetical protein n=1 Tax=Aneurinibacillus aneurinilyticus TaxID=1391 RepID=UPI0023F2A5D9|nr:hypothetical protein [Aneurinibacillus aneurinilyticus]